MERRPWTGRVVLFGVLTISVALWGQGCVLLNIPPPRAPLDELWTRWMLAGHYGRATPEGSPWATPVLPLQNRIQTFPDGAWLTKYGIVVEERASPEGAAWRLDGGLVGRMSTQDSAIELFGKETARVQRTPFELGSAAGRDFTYEFFLVVRPHATGQGRLIRQWRFPPDELALTGSPIDPAILQMIVRRSTRNEAQLQPILSPSMGAYPEHFVDGYLDFDPETRIATVTVTGLKRPFQERVDLSRELRP